MDIQLKYNDNGVTMWTDAIHEEMKRIKGVVHILNDLNIESADIENHVRKMYGTGVV